MPSSYTIPKTQRAAIVASKGAPVVVKDDYPVPTPESLQPGECLVKLHCTGVCHTDLHAALGDWPLDAKTPLIGGHEGVGEVVAIANDTPNCPVKIGQRVGIKWLADSSVLFNEVLRRIYSREISGASSVNSAGRAENKVCLSHTHFDHH